MAWARAVGSVGGENWWIGLSHWASEIQVMVLPLFV